MDIIFETSIYSQQKRGGISRIFNEIIPRICNNTKYNVTLISIEHTLQPLPTHERLRQISFNDPDKYLRPRRFWRRVYEEIACNIIHDTQTKILHSTYYHSIHTWKGPKVLHIYDMIYERYPNFFDNKYDTFFKNRKMQEITQADILICISKTTALELESLYPSYANKTKVVYLAASSIFRIIDHNIVPINLSENKPFILYVGKRDFYKNYSEFLKVYSIWKKNKDFNLYVIGPEWSESEKKSLDELRIKNQIHLFSDLDDENLCYLYNQASALIFPSLFEGFGIPLLEAMACGCPIVASPIPSTIEIANDVPLYFEFGSTESFLSALDQVIVEGRFSDRVSKGLIRVKKFSFEKTTSDILQLYECLA